MNTYYYVINQTHKPLSINCRIVDLQIKKESPVGIYAFITFSDPRDAEDAIRGRNGIEFAGGRIR